MQIVSDQLIPVLYEAPELKLVDEEMFKKTKLAFGNYSDTSSDTAIVPKIEKKLTTMIMWKEALSFLHGPIA